MNDLLAIFRNDPDIQRALASLDEQTATVSAEAAPESIVGRLPAGLLAACDLVGAATPKEIAERLRDFAQAWEAIAHLGGQLGAPIAADGDIDLRFRRRSPE